MEKSWSGEGEEKRVECSQQNANQEDSTVIPENFSI